MKMYEYRIFNLSEVESRRKKLPLGTTISWIDILNELGMSGWEHTGTKLTSQSFLLKREIGASVPDSDIASAIGR